MTTLLATVHPAFALRMRRWQDVLCGTHDGMYVGDIAKAVRAAKGILCWTDPGMQLDPTAEALSAALARMVGRAVAVDTETDGLDPEHCNLRCVGLAVADGPYGGGFGVCATFRSIDGTPGRYVRADGTKQPARCRVADARAIIQAFFARLRQTDGPKAILMHNQVYDQPVLLRHGLHPPDVARVVDTILLHRLADSEMPHDLSFLASTMTDAPAWKPHDHDAWGSDEDLAAYCLRDVCITAACAPRLRDEVVRSGQLGVLRGDLETQRLAIGMRRAGVAVDFAEQRRHGDRLAIAMDESRARADAATDGARINIASADQVRHYLFKRLRMMPSGVETPLGDPSVDKEALYMLLRRALPDRTRSFLAAVLDFRRVQKAKSSFVDNLEVGPDGRVHAVWNAHSPKVGRLACAAPNLTTIPATKHDPDSLRSMFRAAPGNLMFGADYDQLHMRIIAVRANVADWLEVFDRAGRGDTSRAADIHYVNAAKFYGKRIEAVQKFERSNLKTAVYAGAYAAGVDTWLAQYMQVRDPVTGERPYAGITREEVATTRAKWLADTPEIQRWWEREVEAFRQGGELRSMLYGRLLRLKDVRYAGAESADAAVSDIVNAAVLCTEADIAGGNGAAGRAMRRIGWPDGPYGTGYGDGRGVGGPGLTMHVHDALYGECAASRAQEAKAALRESMETVLTWEGRSVKISCKPKSGVRWSELE